MLLDSEHWPYKHSSTCPFCPKVPESCAHTSDTIRENLGDEGLRPYQMYISTFWGVWKDQVNLKSSGLRYPKSIFLGNLAGMQKCCLGSSHMWVFRSL